MSVLACDVADILSLSEDTDPEELREVLARCHETGAAVVRGLEGHLAKADEGRLVAYFGYPVAHEDDAQRAVRAALSIVAELSQPDPARAASRTPLLPRAAVHTGLMVAGDARSSGPGLVGNAPAIAARLLERAQPGSVVVSSDTRPLVERLFDLEEAGDLSLPGLSRPVTLARVLRESAAEPSGISRAALTPFVGRDEDLALIVARFQLAREGHGQAVLVTGEPGIGKSRLLFELGERLRDEPHFLLECRSSPYHTSHALHPVIEMLARLARLEDTHTPDEKRERLARALEPVGATPETVALADGRAVAAPGRGALAARAHAAEAQAEDARGAAAAGAGGLRAQARAAGGRGPSLARSLERRGARRAGAPGDGSGRARDRDRAAGNEPGVGGRGARDAARPAPADAAADGAARRAGGRARVRCPWRSWSRC